MRLGQALPERLGVLFSELTVLGIGTLDPLLAELLMAMDSKGCRITVHLLLPSLHFLGDLRQRPRLSVEGSCEDLVLPTSHPLLLTMGKQAVGSFILAGELDENYTHWPTDPPPAQPPPLTLLQRLQSDIRTLSWPPEARPCHKEDISVRIHSCHGPRREMEVLRDELHRAFRDLPDLRPEEVVILAPSLETYAPLASAVFGPQSGLTVRLTELPPSEQDPLLEALSALLQLALGRQTASELLDLLSLRAVRDCLGADEDQKVERLQDWIRASGLTEGGATSSSAPSASIGSWDFALHRLVAGYWLGDEPEAQEGCVFLLPVAEDLAGDLAMRTRFFEWLSQLQETVIDWRSAEFTPSEWADKWQTAAERLLCGKETEPSDLAELAPLRYLRSLDCQPTLDAGAILDWLKEQAAETRRKGTVGGGIAMGRFKQLQSIPCRILAIVGMQETAFPSPHHTLSWDLIASSPKIWDRHARMEDRQLFLDALLTPTDRLIVTASTRNVRTGKEEPFSSCVDELLRVLLQMTGGDHAIRKQLIIHHRLAPYASDYFQPDSPLPHSFQSDMAAIATTLANQDARHGCPLIQPTKSPAPVIPSEIALSQLIAFWKDPAKAFLKAQQIAPLDEEEDDQNLDRPSLKLDGLGAWKIKAMIIDKRLSSNSVALASDEAAARGNRQLPPGALGSSDWEEADQIVREITDTIRGFQLETQKLSTTIQIGSQTYTVTGDLQLGKKGATTTLLFWSVGKFESPHHKIPPWISAVFAAAAGQSRPSLLVGADCSGGKAINSPIQNAPEILTHLVEGYLEGQSLPLCYAPATSACLTKEFASPEEQAKALQAAQSKWEAPAYGDTSVSEGLKPHSQLAWRDADPFDLSRFEEWMRWGKQIAKPLADWKDAPSKTKKSAD